MQLSTQFIDPLFNSFFYMQCVPFLDQFEELHIIGEFQIEYLLSHPRKDEELHRRRQIRRLNHHRATDPVRL